MDVFTAKRKDLKEKKKNKMKHEKFYDEVKIFVKGGKGGDGCVSFRREKGVPRGGPDGGDGGDGGSIILKANKKVSTLVYFHHKSHFIAQNGEHGKGSNRTGKRGKDVILWVPLGTVVKDGKGKTLADLKKEGDFFIAAHGGKGGRGNAQFKSATYQAPKEAEKGKEGEERYLILELKIIADVGIIGLPNAGKSTLLSRISNARPKIAPYPFTTLRPHLGIVKVDEFNSFVAADLPGLIEKASEGKGLGDRFLRHVERSKVLLHLIDVGEDIFPNPVERFYIINQELEQYNPELLKKPQLVAGNKLDLPGAKDRLDQLKKEIGNKYPVIGISAQTGEGLNRLLKELLLLIQEEKNKESRHYS